MPTPVYHVALTEPEYRFLYRLAPDGIQAAMAATLWIEYLDSSSPLRETDGRAQAVRVSRQKALGGVPGSQTASSR